MTRNVLPRSTQIGTPKDSLQAVTVVLFVKAKTRGRSQMPMSRNEVVVQTCNASYAANERNKVGLLQKH